MTAARSRHVSAATLARILAVVMAHPDGIASKEVAKLGATSMDHTLRALRELQAAGKLDRTSQGGCNPRWASLERVAAIRAAMKEAARERQREANRQQKRRADQRKRDEADQNWERGAFRQVVRPAGTWERQHTEQLSPATWLCPALV